MASIVIRNSSYHYEELKASFFEIADLLAGDKIKAGQLVLIKPNMLSAAKPQDAILTHPLVVKAAVEYVLSKGARPQVSDSPAIGSFEHILNANGMKEALSGMDVVCQPFKNTRKVDIGKPYGSIDIASDAIEADVIINLPKLKTHSQMLLTLAVKNMFGCIVGFEKSHWHMRAGVDTVAFARLLIAIHQAVIPTVSILDGIIGLEGEGPGKAGKPRNIGVLIGSCNSFALDAAVCKMIGVSCDKVPILKEAAESNLIPSIEIDGTLPQIDNFQLPGINEIIFGPRFLHNFLRKHTLAQPVCNDELCELCSKCWTICPAKAIRPVARKIEFDYAKCIRCYCCIEVCPYAALHVRSSLSSRIVQKLINKFS